MLPKISIITPVYNTEKYLCQCIDSILAQTFTDFELLLIDDGSTDKSGVICDEYATKDTRVRVFHKVNGGVSSARNLGLNNAKGEWVTFVDSDDELYKDSLSEMLSNVNQLMAIDFIVYGYDYFDNVSNKISYSTSDKDNRLNIYSKSDGISNFYENELDFWSWFICSKLFRLEIIRDKKIKFNERIKFSEDRLFIMMYLCHLNNNILFNSYSTYRYRIHNDSIMGQSNIAYNRDSITGVEAVILMYDQIKKKSTSRYNLFLAIRDMVLSYRTQIKIMNKFEVVQDDYDKIDNIFYSRISKYKSYLILFISKLLSTFPLIRRIFKNILK